MDKFNTRHTAFAIILFFSITLFFNLDKMEIQPWDEGLYAYRAKMINEKDVWWDQTEYTIGGLYSSSYPPLTVWAMALSMKFIEPQTAVRLFSVVCASLSFLMIFLISRRLLDDEMSLLVIIGLAATIVWNKYSRQGMTEVPVVTFSLISLWAVLKIKESASNLHSFLYSGFFILAFAAALMSKVLVSFLPLLFVIIYLFRNDNRNKKIILIFSSVSAILIALPWHLYMIGKYGYDFYKIFLASHIYSAVEGNTQSLGIFYYINQLLISNPFFILAIFLLVFALFKYKTIIQKSKNKYLMTVLFVWLGGLLVLFSLSTTKLPHYLVYMVVPAVILSGFLFEEYIKIIKSEKLKWILMTLLIAVFFWSISYDLRQEMKMLLAFKGLTIKSVFYLITIAAMFGLVFVFNNDKLKKMTETLFERLSYIILIVLVIRVISTGMLFNYNPISGGKETAFILEKEEQNSFVYLYHEHNKSDVFNPQLVWYTEGWTIGTRKGKEFFPMALPKSRIDIKVIQKTDLFKNIYLVYYIPDDWNLAKSVIRELIETRPIIKKTKNYIIFGNHHWNRKKGKNV